MFALARGPGLFQIKDPHAVGHSGSLGSVGSDTLPSCVPAFLMTDHLGNVNISLRGFTLSPGLLFGAPWGAVLSLPLKPLSL